MDERVARHKNETGDYRRAQRLRREASFAERTLWFALRMASKNTPFSFRRQHPIRPYVVDFACLKIRLVIELDGASHDNRQEQDAAREKYLAGLGYMVVRFSNQDVAENIDGVAATIMEQARELSAGVGKLGEKKGCRPM
jgi:very-short-patch-repair endonuclease